VYASDVLVTTNAGNHNHGSSMVKLKNLVDYNWEPKFYSGQLLAIHMSGKYLAYSIKGFNSSLF
jgi:enhancer of mRNA-decapping protein 4